MPHIYIYFNDGGKRSQLRCKVCGDVFQLHIRFRKPYKYFCPFCSGALFTWKQATIYKCHNQKCPHRKEKLSALNVDEKKLRQKRPSQFEINYQYRGYHFQPGELKVAEPKKPTVDLHRIHNDINIFALILILHISYGNPSYQACLHFVNAKNDDLNLTLKNVIGLQNLSRTGG